MLRWTMLAWLLMSRIALGAPPAGWELVGTKEGVEVARKTMDGSDLFAFRGEAIVDIPLPTLSALLLSDLLGPEWVDLMNLSRMVARSSPTEKIVHQGYGLPWPIQDRDYVMRQTATYDDETKVFTLMFQSIEDARVPVAECCVRAEAYRTFWQLQVQDDGKTHAVVEVYTDPKGKLPAWLVNLIQKDWPVNTITMLEARAAQGGFEDDPMAAGW